ncbi:MAG TPA: hypothetical protein PLL33_06825 [Paracoccus sp. (in: a-proteobacteria)]|nr:hypothetical protein [Paracoccus sp. (in: a-proteobacteria)]
MSTIFTAAGRYFDFAAPESAYIEIGEIAHALSHLCRFTGHVREFYSVAEHSWHVSHLVPPADALAGLLHDAPEAFIGDVARPLKALLPDYRAIEARVEAAVLGCFGLDPQLPASVKAADRDMLRVEQVQAMRAGGQDWSSTAGSFAHPAARLVELRFWEPRQARMMFLRRFEELTA